jgi:integrase
MRQAVVGTVASGVALALLCFHGAPAFAANGLNAMAFGTESVAMGGADLAVARDTAARKAVEWGMVEEDTLKRVRRVKLLQENNRRLRYLSQEECVALVDACGTHLRPIVLTALNTGMRKEEILSLEWEKHIDLRHGFILLDQTKNGERREVPINQSVRTVLAGITRRIDSPYVFVNGQGHRYQDVKKSIDAACRRAGIKDFRFHDLRHTFASHLVMAGIDITTVKALLGHKTLTMTLRYAHLAQSHTQNAVSVLDIAMNGCEATVH